MAKHDQNNTGNNTDFNRGSRDHASSREMAGMRELARPGGGSPKHSDDGCYEEDTDFKATNTK